MDRLKKTRSQQNHRGCFSFMPRINRRGLTDSIAKRINRISWPQLSANTAVESEAMASLQKTAKVSEVTSFAECDSETPRSSSKTSEIILLRPYFGHFAGKWLSFHLKRKESMTSVKVYLRSDERDESPALATFIHTQRQNLHQTIRDRCIKFAQEMKPLVVAEDKPSKLSFLCEQKLLLNLKQVDVTTLPVRYRDWALYETQDVSVSVWPNHVCRNPIQMRVKRWLSIRELQWMLCKKLTLPSPNCIELYQFDDLKPLSPDTPLTPNTLKLECVLLPQQPSRPPVFANLRVVVSVIGFGMVEVPATPGMSLYKFQLAVKERMALTRPHNSFLYFHQVFEKSYSPVVVQSGLKHSTLIDDSTITLIDACRRNLPIIDGIPSLQIDIENLPLYQTSIGELGLLKCAPIIAFQVTGPTIPIVFQSTSSHSYCHTFALMEWMTKPHAVSVNPTWTVETLLKYIQCISGVPCDSVNLGKNVLQKDTRLGKCITNRCWLLQTRSFTLALPNDLPHIQPPNT